jgi:hypothetical protein
VLEREIFQIHLAEKMKTHFMFSNVFQILCRLCDHVAKCGAAREVADDKMAHARCMLGK